MRKMLKILWVAIIVNAFSAITMSLNAFSFWSKIPWSIINLISFIVFSALLWIALYKKDQQIKKLTDEDAQRRREIERLDLKAKQENDQFFGRNSGQEGYFKK